MADPGDRAPDPTALEVAALEVAALEVAALEAAGLYDSNAADAAERLALLEYLIGLGATVDDLVAAGPDSFGMLGSSLALWGGRERMTLAEVAAAAGIEEELVSRAWLAAGFPEPDPDPDVRAFTQPDVEILTVLSAATKFFGEDVTMQLVRVIGAAASRVADAGVTAFIVNVAPPASESDPSGLELVRANVESIVLLDGVKSVFDTLLRHNIERGFRPIGGTETASGIDLVHKSVGFADLVDSTAWTQQLDLPALSRALGTFDSHASEIVVGGGGRVVKLIGDGVMFVSDDPIAAAEIALNLVDTFASHDLLPPVRVGIATGDVLARDGDYSGAVVNLAARAVSVARPSSLLVDPDTRAALEASLAYVCHTAGKFSLKGFEARVQLTRVRRSESA